MPTFTRAIYLLILTKNDSSYHPSVLSPDYFNSLKSSLSELEDFLIQVAAQEERITLHGWRYLISNENSHSSLIQFLSDIPSALRDVTSIAKGYAPTLAQDFLSLSEDADFIPNLERLVTRLRQVSFRRIRTPIMSEIAFKSLRVFGYISKRSLILNALDIEAIITGLRRFRRYVVELERHVEAIGDTREDVFNPKGLDPEKIVAYLDDAIRSIRGSRVGSTEYGRYLISHLEKARAEAASEKPSWKSLIGGIVVAAAIISAIADAPDAADSITKAYNYIMKGTEHFPVHDESPLFLPVARVQETQVHPENEDSVRRLLLQ